MEKPARNWASKREKEGPNHEKNRASSRWKICPNGSDH